MELNLHPIATHCCLTGRAFAEHDRVVCYLVREENGLTGRRDLLETEDSLQVRPATVYCRWVVGYKPRRGDDNPDRTLKLTAENLFLTLADPANPADEANTPLLQFLALMLERKRLLKLRGRTADGQRQIFEHLREHRLYEVPVGRLDDAFFIKIQEQLGILVGTPAPKPAASPAVAGAAAETGPVAALASPAGGPGLA